MLPSHADPSICPFRRISITHTWNDSCGVTSSCGWWPADRAFGGDDSGLRHLHQFHTPGYWAVVAGLCGAAVVRQDPVLQVLARPAPVRLVAFLRCPSVPGTSESALARFQSSRGWSSAACHRALHALGARNRGTSALSRKMSSVSEHSRMISLLPAMVTGLSTPS